MTRNDLAKAYPWTSDIELPQMVQTEINQLLTLAATMHEQGGEMHMSFVGINAEGHRWFLDCIGVPKEIAPSWVMMAADKNEFVALVMCTEGWTVPEEVAKRWHTDSRPEGQIREQPEAYEVLMVQVETQLGTWMGQRKIVGEDTNRTVKETIHLTKTDRVVGRFNNLLKINANQPENLLATLGKALEAKAYLASQPEQEEQSS